MMTKKLVKKRIFFMGLSFIIISSVLISTQTIGSSYRLLSDWAKPAKNVIVLIPDGCSASQLTITRWYTGEPLALDEMISGGVRTYGADSIITDSAPAATAFATGCKSSDKFIGVLPDSITTPGVPKLSDDLKMKPIATVLEGAELSGKATGLIATSNIQHATPAAFSAHWPDRSNYNEIAEQQVYLDIDVVFGGGKQYLIPETEGGKRIDSENLINVLKERNYEFIESRNELLNLNLDKVNKVWGMFAEDAMNYDFDRKELFPDQPSLSEMTEKAIEILSKNRKGFFLFVEGSQVDWASHANDPVGVVSEVLAFDEAVKVALDFAKKDGRTLVLSFTDHGNGGMSIGNKSTSDTYSKMNVEPLITPLKKAKLSGAGIEIKLSGNLSDENIKSVLLEYYGIDDLTDEEIIQIKNAKKGSINYVVGPIISERSIIGWTTNGHTGEDVFLYSYGPNRPIGLIENTEIANITAENLGFDLAYVNDDLFVEVDSIASELEAQINIDDTDKNNPVLSIKKGDLEARLPFSKDILLLGSKKYDLPGLTIFAPKKNKIYVPKEVLIILEKKF